MLVKRIFSTVLVALLVGTGIWVWQSRSPTESDKEMTPLRIAVSQTGLLIWIAEDKGFFAEQGLNVEMQNVQGGHQAMQKLLAGETEIAASSEFTLVAQSFKGSRLQVISTVSTLATIGLTVRKDRGIKTLSDLQGKRIGVTMGSAADFFLYRFLAINGLSAADVEFVAMDPKQIVDSLVAGDIDAGFTWEPNNFDMREQLGEKAAFYPGQGGQDLHFILTARPEWIEKNPTAIKRMLMALIKAEQFTMQNTAEAQQIIIRRFGIDPTFLAILWQQHKPTIALPQSLLTSMDEAALWKIEGSKMGRELIPNYLDFIYLSGLEAVRPETLTIIR